ncbi:BrxA/BrxB family bacilliredoxin [uncultured Weeksella sp.]|uniref:BrxA/BrxB family bacilliredoxin n=1 Tax=uncultured Weeksella sp. TaxID=1161389 RepID=UPI00259BC739|nr:BrxA/BrxB family bacilliredoxin [uncultured Weeksella sp.]
MYPSEIVLPMKEQLTSHGFQDLTSAQAVEEALQQPGTTLVMVNSVCGCAAGAARPGVLLSLDNEKVPSNLTTVFAGYDIDAVAKAREHFAPFPPSSPAIALFKDGELVHMLERHHIEGHSAEVIADNLKSAYNDFV